MDGDHILPRPPLSPSLATPQIGRVAASIREWGWTNPVLVTEAEALF
jgi:hypothetical protein